MNVRRLAVILVATTALAGALGCSSDARNAVGQDGVAGNAGASNLSSAGGASSPGVDSACPEQPVPQRTQGTLLSLALHLVLAGKPFVFGQPNLLADGGSLVPLNLRLYISDVKLLRADAEPLAVDLMTAAGAPSPYGVHFFNAEDADSGTLRVLAPPGEYTGLSFAFGIGLSCNRQIPNSLTDPLTDASQMTWPHTGGFLFFRYEGRLTAADGGGAAGASAEDEIPPAVHMGGDITKELVPYVTASGALSVPSSGTLEHGLQIVMDEIFKGATSDVDISDASVGPLSAPETQAGERLRRDLSELHVFALER